MATFIFYSWQCYFLEINNHASAYSGYCSRIRNSSARAGASSSNPAILTRFMPFSFRMMILVYPIPFNLLRKLIAFVSLAKLPTITL